MIYAILIASRKLRHYFQAHAIQVVTSYPLERVLHHRGATGRVSKWTVELGAFELRFTNSHTIKSQALADFVAEWTPTTPDETARAAEASKPRWPTWTMHFDGSKCESGAGAGVILTSPQGDKMKYVLRMKFRASNNKAEYEALIDA